MSDDNDKMGFAGLRSLVSEVDETVAEPANREDQAEKSTARREKPQSSQRATAPLPRSWPTPKTDHNVSKSDSRKHTSSSPLLKWFVGFIVLACGFIWLLNIAQEDDGGSSSVSSITSPASSPRNMPVGTSGEQVYDLEFSKPPVGDNNLLSVAQIRWCFRQVIQIEVLRPLPTSIAQIDQFNAVVTDYNSRCGSYRYRPGALTRAQREVESVRARIVATVQPPWQASISSGRSALQQQSRLILDVQNGLIALGYEPGAPDGLYGSRTRSAIHSFQRDIGLATDGQVTQALLERLRTEVASRRSRALRASSGGGTSPSSTAGSERGSTGTFTRNSHENEVLRLQGTPSEIIRFDLLGHETWQFGLSTVEIDSRTRRVLEWSNDGNLRVQLLPGDRVTSSSAYTIGSHEDDVLRLQGTPSQIIRFDLLGHETWQFGLSTVEIDSRTRRVLEWNNDGNLKVEMRPGDRVTSSSGYTRGSHEDDVLRLQGTPTKIVRFDLLGHEDWQFGLSTVEIDSRTRRVLEWNNDGNLKVEMRPGDRVTSSSGYTRGSHEDDVLRLQGTPTKIVRFDLLGHEDWHFGLSTVEIDSRTRRVLEWNNDGNLKVEMRPGDRVTSSSGYTRGSHEDDVLRLQGTPTKIVRFDLLGHEDWHFGRSRVKIDSRTRRVLEWNNDGNLKVRQ